jgi:hypothetical protein
MSSPDQMRQPHSGIHRLAIVRIAVAQLAVMLALAAAVVFYLDWSSKVAQAEFMAATRAPASDPNRLPQPPNGRAGCLRRA